MKKQKFCWEKLLLMLSGTAFLALIVPAWIQGFLWCGVSAVILCITVQRLPVPRERLRGLLADPVCAVLGLVVNGALAVNFYHNWADSRNMEAVASMLHLRAELLVPLAGGILAVAAAPAAASVVSYYVKTGMEDYRAAKQLDAGKKGIPMGRTLLILSLVYVLGISALIRANFYYMDDLPRTAFGYKQWDYFSRYLSTAMATLVHGGDFLADVAPLPQILAMVIMAVSAVCMLYIVYERTSFSLWEIAAVIPLGLNPYILGCVSFRFDAPYMTLSVLCGVFPLLFRKKSTAAYVLAGILGILGVCTSYQAAAGIFPMLVIFLALRMWGRGGSLRELARLVVPSAAGYLLGLLFFKLVIMIPADAGYVANALPSAGQLLPNFFGNLKTYYSLIWADFKPFWRICTVLLLAAFVLRSVFGGSRRGAAAFLMTAGALALMGTVCFGLYPALAATVYAPRAMYGFGVMLALWGMVAAEGEGQIPLKVPAVILAWVFFSFSFLYGNALSVQKDYTEFRTRMLVADLQDMEIFRSGDPVTVQLSGTIGRAPVLENMPQNYQMLNRLVPETFGGGDDLIQYGFYCYYDLKNVVWDMETDLRDRNLVTVKDTMYHTIRSGDNCILVELK